MPEDTAFCYPYCEKCGLDAPVLEAVWIAYLAAAIGLAVIAIVCRPLETK